MHDARTNAEDLGPFLNGMAAAMLTAAELFGKDADLDRNDVLGEIDLAAARQALALARQYAHDIVALGQDHVVVQAGPGLTLRRLALLLANRALVIEERMVPALGRLVDEALFIPQGSQTGTAIAAFDKSYAAAVERLVLTSERTR